MKCKKCLGEVSALATFCSACGSPLVSEEDLKTPSEVSLEWLRSILEGQGYKVKPGKEPDTIWATHEAAATFVLTIRRGIRVITVEGFWRLKKPGWGQKADFLAALNKANSLNWFITVSSSDPFETLAMTSFIFMTERLSSRDVVFLLESYDEAVKYILKKSGLQRFA